MVGRGGTETMVQGGEASAPGSWVGRGRMRIAVMASLFCSLVTALYAANGLEPPDPLLFYVSFLPTMAVLLWMVHDARQHRIAAVHDFGFFLMLFWPIVLPWYCFKSRGARGWLLFAGLLGLILAPWLTALAFAGLR